MKKSIFAVGLLFSLISCNKENQLPKGVKEPAGYLKIEVYTLIGEGTLVIDDSAFIPFDSSYSLKFKSKEDFPNVPKPENDLSLFFDGRSLAVNSIPYTYETHIPIHFRKAKKGNYYFMFRGVNIPGQAMLIDNYYTYAGQYANGPEHWYINSNGKTNYYFESNNLEPQNSEMQERFYISLYPRGYRYNP